VLVCCEKKYYWLAYKPWLKPTSEQAAFYLLNSKFKMMETSGRRKKKVPSHAGTTSTCGARWLGPAVQRRSVWLGV